MPSRPGPAAPRRRVALGRPDGVPATVSALARGAARGAVHGRLGARPSASGRASGSLARRGPAGPGWLTRPAHLGWHRGEHLLGDGRRARQPADGMARHGGQVAGAACAGRGGMKSFTIAFIRTAWPASTSRLASSRDAAHRGQRHGVRGEPSRSCRRPAAARTCHTRCRGGPGRRRRSRGRCRSPRPRSRASGDTAVSGRGQVGHGISDCGHGGSLLGGMIGA